MSYCDSVASSYFKNLFEKVYIFRKEQDTAVVISTLEEYKKESLLKEIKELDKSMEAIRNVAVSIGEFADSLAAFLAQGFQAIYSAMQDVTDFISSVEIDDKNKILRPDEDTFSERAKYFSVQPKNQINPVKRFHRYQIK